MKRTLLCLLAVCLLLLYTACQKETLDPTPSPSTATQETENVNVLPTNEPVLVETTTDEVKAVETEAIEAEVLLSDALPTVKWGVEPYFSRVVKPGDWSWMTMEALTKLPHYIFNSDDSFQVDLRHRDLSALDLTNSLYDLLKADFNYKTVWPEQMPVGFDPETILAYGKDPGLGVRMLHEQGITGKGISIGIIDQVLLPDHVEYAGRVMYYEEIPTTDEDAYMHGSGVASLAAGKNCGVAPEAHIYYIASELRNADDNITYEYYAIALNRLLDINRELPDGEKIRVVSISRGFDATDEGFQNMMAAITRAKNEGVFVVTTSSNNIEEYGFYFAGLGREPMGDPNDINTYSVGIFEKPYASYFGDWVFFPMDSRAYASCTAIDGYDYNSIGGMSWMVPYIAGLYALCAQEYPDITPYIFDTCVKATADSITVDNLGSPYDIKYLVNPVRLLDMIRSGDFPRPEIIKPHKNG